jgi:hypothetical protein
MIWYNESCMRLWSQNAACEGVAPPLAQAMCMTQRRIVVLTDYENIAGYGAYAKRSIENGETSNGLRAPTANAPIASPVIGASRMPFRPCPHA